MRLLGALEAGGVPTTDEYTDGLEALNAMVASWNNEGLMCFAHQEESLTLSASTATYTVGPTGTLVTTRPVAIDYAWVVASNISYPVEIISDEMYGSIQDKTATSTWPTKINYKAGMSNGTITVYPVPSATTTLKLLTRVPLSSFATTATTVTLPPGWEQALAFNLAVTWAPEFEVDPRAAVIQTAKDSKAWIKRINGKPIEATSELGALLRQPKSRILTGP